MTEDIKQTVGQTVNNAVNSAVDSGSEAIRNGLNSVFGSQNQGTYQNKTKEFEERRRREREQEEQKRLENEKAKERMLTLYEKNTGGRMKGLMLSVSGGILASGMGLGTFGSGYFRCGWTYEFTCVWRYMLYGGRSTDRCRSSCRRT